MSTASVIPGCGRKGEDWLKTREKRDGGKGRREGSLLFAARLTVSCFKTPCEARRNAGKKKNVKGAIPARSELTKRGKKKDLREIRGRKGEMTPYGGGDAWLNLREECTKEEWNSAKGKRESREGTEEEKGRLNRNQTTY